MADLGILFFHLNIDFQCIGGGMRTLSFSHHCANVVFPYFYLVVSFPPSRSGYVLQYVEASNFTPKTKMIAKTLAF